MEDLIEDKQCSHCSGTIFRRINRKGYIQRVILPWLGYYPWECVSCRNKTFFKDAGHRPSARGTIA